MDGAANQRRGVAVPSTRLSRLTRMGSLATGVAGRVAAGAARELAGGRRPALGDLLMTPANAARMTRELAQLRGAAMKLGQLLSMEAGDFLPREMADIFARLRADADPMPPAQLRRVLDRQWGRGWLSRFERFDVNPIAAASIGQVHRARTRDGRDLAIKIQYPGVRDSIDSDLRNVAGLMRLAGGMPEGLDLMPLMDEARRQLHEEADYEREGRYLAQFGAWLDGDPAFRVPRLHADFTTPDILAMDYVAGTPVEALTEAPQAVRDTAIRGLLALVLRELFEFGTMQTDPNFANYRIETATGRVVLLDFGAARPISAELSARYRDLLRASLARDRPGIRNGLIALDIFDAEAIANHEARLARMIDLGLGALHALPPFDFADRSVAKALRDEGMALAGDRDMWHIPPAEVLFVQRKLAGMYLLATRLEARVDIAGLVAPWMETC